MICSGRRGPAASPRMGGARAWPGRALPRCPARERPGLERPARRGARRNRARVHRRQPERGRPGPPEDLCALERLADRRVHARCGDLTRRRPGGNGRPRGIPVGAGRGDRYLPGIRASATYVDSVAWSGDGSRLVTAGIDGTGPPE